MRGFLVDYGVDMEVYDYWLQWYYPAWLAWHQNQTPQDASATAVDPATTAVDTTMTPAEDTEEVPSAPTADGEAPVQAFLLCVTAWLARWHVECWQSNDT